MPKIKQIRSVVWDQAVYFTFADLLQAQLTVLITTLKIARRMSGKVERVLKATQSINISGAIHLLMTPFTRIFIEAGWQPISLRKRIHSHPNAPTDSVLLR